MQLHPTERKPEFSNCITPKDFIEKGISDEYFIEKISIRNLSPKKSTNFTTRFQSYQKLSKGKSGLKILEVLLQMFCQGSLCFCVLKQGHYRRS